MRHHIILAGVLLLIYHVTSQISLTEEMIPMTVFLQKTPWAQSNSNKRLGCKSVLKGAYAPIDCICSFLEDQINMHATPEFTLAQTYRIGWDYVLPQGVPNWGPYGAYYQSVRADVYDNALAAIMLMNSGQMESAKRICDTFVLLVNLDKIGDGRTRSAYYHTNPIQRDYDGVTPITYGTRVQNNDVLTGNLAFQIIALGRWYHHTKDFKYLQAAIKIAKFIKANFKYDSAWGGFTAGILYNTTTGEETKLNWRSIEHNADIFAAARLLYGLTNDDQWKEMMNQAKGFVSNMYEQNGGFYYIGAPNALNSDSPVTAYPTGDAQTWNYLSEADDDVDRKTQSLLWLISNLIVTEYQQDPLTGQTIQYDGVIFSTGGTGIQSEQTASAAMAFYGHGKRIQISDPVNSQLFLDTAKKLLTTLLNMQKYAIRSDGHGIVASVNPLGAKSWPGDESTGESMRYLPLLHTAASSWTGLALHFIENDDAFANPYADYSKKTISKYITTAQEFGQIVSASSSSESQSINNSYNIGVATLALSLGVGCMVFIALAILAILNIRLYRKNKELQEMDQGNDREMQYFNRLNSTSTPGTPNADFAQ